MTQRPVPAEAAELLDVAASGSRLGLARLLSMIQRGDAAARLTEHLTRAGVVTYTIGVTGAPGAGKSTLTDRLLTAARAGWPDGEPIPQVAVLAVDPSSPFTGGAILGDRIRMQRHATDPSIFIRSFATRGHMGGLAAAVPDAIRVLAAVGYPLVLVETVGVGQVEVDVASTADSTVVVLTPRWGDSTQANKAGLLEVADILVVNKADQPGTGGTRRDLEQMLDLFGERAWRPPVVETSATDGAGVDELWSAIAAHRAHLTVSGELDRRRAERAETELERAVRASLSERVRPLLEGPAGDRARSDVAAGRVHPRVAADRLVQAADRSATCPALPDRPGTG